MRCLLVLAVFVVAAFAQHHNDFDHLIINEVKAIISANSGISADDCTAKCDAMFDLIDGHDETHTDNVCKHACECEINKTCDHHHTHPPAPTDANNPHPTHPTHPPHHGHQG